MDFLSDQYFWVYLIVAFLPALLGQAFVRRSMEWYSALNKGPGTPPGAAIGAIWLILYLLIGISAYRVYTQSPSTWYTITFNFILAFVLLLNLIWVSTFFGKKDPAGSFQVLLVLLGASMALAVMTFNVDKTAFYLLVPYLVWLFFAIFYNNQITVLNPPLLT